MTDALLSVEGLTKHFPVTRGVMGRVVGQVRAVDDVSFEIGSGETLGLVGESGCGKTTVGRTILRLLEPTGGKVLFEGKDVASLPAGELRELRRDMQVIFQDPFSSLNPRMRVLDIVGEALEVHGIAKGRIAEERVAAVLRRVGLPPAWINRYPHEFSGGQRQRIGVARAIALDPKLIVCDEAVSALDVSIQAQVINLLIELQRELHLSYLFIAHDLSVVRHISHRVAVMYLGEVAELASSKRLFSAPAHPYTRALLSAIPVPTPRRQKRRIVLSGDVPTPLNPPSGCRFHTRCPAVFDRCRTEPPALVTVEEGHTVRCFHSYDLDPGADWYRQVSERIERAMRDNDRAPRAMAAPSAAPTNAAVMRDDGTEPTATESVPAGGERAAPAEEATTPLPTRRTVGAMLSGFGVFLALFGSWVLGALAAIGGYALLRPALTHRRRADAIAFATVIAVGAASLGFSMLRRTNRAELQLTQLTEEIKGRYALTRRHPESLDELGWRLYGIFEDGHPIDPWGRPWRYGTPGSDGRPYDLGSHGRDGVPSNDDIGHPPRAR